MKELLENLKTNLLDKLPPRISETLKESIEQSERNEFAPSLQSLSGSIFHLLQDEYYIPSGLVWNEGMGALEMIRELRKAGKDLGKSETDAILRIQEKAKLDDTDSVVLESCFQGAVEVFESYLREKGNRVQKKVEATERKSPGRLILREIDTFLEESDTEEKIRENFLKLEEIYRDFPYDKDVKMNYFQYLSHVNRERAKKEILGYLEGGDVTIHLGAVCISLLAEMGFMYDAKKKLDWYQEEFSEEKDGIYTELFVFMHTFLKEGKSRDKQIVEGLSNIIGQRKELYYIYIENCFMIFSEREDSIKQRSEGLYFYKESIFREKTVQSKAEKKVRELRQEQEKKEAKKSEDIKESVKKEVESKTVEKIHILERKPEPISNQTRNESQLDKTFTNSIGMEFVLIPAGEFLMGAVSQDREATDAEKPQHTVRITKPFYLGKYPVTQEEWEKVMGNNPSYFKETKEGVIFKKIIKNFNNPVESVSWYDIQLYIKKLNQKEGRQYGLPTEAEWEFAARGGGSTSLVGEPGRTTPTDYYVYTYGDGSGKLEDYAWYKYSEKYLETTHPVGKKKHNSIGLCDVMGNVWEWCEDWYDGDYYKNSSIADPKGTDKAGFKVLRGGSWGGSTMDCRLSYRGRNSPDSRNNRSGFRLVLLP